MNADGTRISCKSTSLFMMAPRLDPSTILKAADDVRPACATVPAASRACVTDSCVSAVLESSGAYSGIFSVKIKLLYTSN